MWRCPEGRVDAGEISNGAVPAGCYPRAAAAKPNAAERGDRGSKMADGRVVIEAQEAEIRHPDDAGQGIDLAMVEQALRGELDAFNQLVVRHQDHLFALVYRLVPDRDQAADVVQEAFFSAYRNLGAFRGGSVKSWLGRIAVNEAMDLQRSRRRRPSQPYPELEDESWQPPAEQTVEPESRTLAGERSRALAGALAALPFDQRNCIVLFDVEGYDYGEIARIMGVSVGTVKSRIHRGRVALRASLEPVRELFRG
jgi:RNA polymerase sigma-70 factor (ECF subfamily)